MPPASPQQVAAGLVELLTTEGQGDYIGGAISQVAHSLQTARQARSAQADDNTILAALLHDIGQFLPAAEVKALAHEVREMDCDTSEGTGASVGRIRHERIGAEYLLRLGFSRKVAALVGSHVAAKRFLCATEPEYFGMLSEASRTSLRFQGGPTEGAELDAWVANPWCAEMCRLRRWDDGAKVVGLVVESIEDYQEMIVQQMSDQRYL